MMRIATRLALTLGTSFVLFVIGVAATFCIDVAVHGSEVLDRSAGAKFSVTMESLAVGTVLAFIGFVTGARFSTRILPDSAHPKKDEAVEERPIQ
jgi:hypothetical protein